MSVYWVLLIPFAVFLVLIHKVYQARTLVIRSWHGISSFERACLWTGTCLYLCKPFLGMSPAGETASAQLVIDVVDALANGLFILGAIAFLQRGHDIEKAEKGET